MKTFLSIAILAFPALAQGNNSQSGNAGGLVDARDELSSVTTYIQDREKKFAIQGKTFDMFGLPQNPRKAQQAQQARKVATAAPKVALPLQEIVDALPVTMIDPMSDKVVLRGAPPFSKGQTLELVYHGQKVVLIFEGSRANGAYFRDMKSRKLKLHRMMQLPKGIKPGNDKRLIAGGIRKQNDSQHQKIELNLTLPGGPRGPAPK